MRFKFLGGKDSDDWLLANISTISKLTVMQVKLTGMVIVKSYLANASIPYEKLTKTTKSQLSDFELKEVVSGIMYIILQSARFKVQESNLDSELQQLGLPKLSAASIAKIYGSNRTALMDELKKRTLTLPRVKKMSWRLDYVVSSSFKKDCHFPEIHLNFDIDSADGEIEQKAISLSASQFRALHHDLKRIQGIIKQQT